MKKKTVESKKSAEQSKNSNGNKESIIVDPNGSYTGTPEDKNEVPVQDVDDL